MNSKPTFTQQVRDLLAGKGLALRTASTDEIIAAINDLVFPKSAAQTPAPNNPRGETDTQTTTPNQSPNMSFSKLLGADTNTITPARAAATFTSEVSRLVREQGVSLDTAWAQVKATEPDLYAKISEKSAPSAADPAALSNSLPAPAPAGANKAFYLPAMQLPANTPDDVFAEAWKANGGKATPLHAQDVFMALMAYLAQTKKLPLASARSEILDSYPGLAAAAGQSNASLYPPSPEKLPSSPLPRTSTF